MTNSEILAATLDTSAAASLAGRLAEQLADGEGVSLDGSQVDRIGQSCLQVLLSARATARAANLPFAIHRASEALETMARVAGCPDLVGGHIQTEA